MRDPQHQVEIYHILNVLMEEQEEEVFKQEMEAFINVWESKEPQFILYFKKYYAQRCGE